MINSQQQQLQTIDSNSYFLSIAASTNDPVVMAKYKLGYSECVQECINFMNTNGSNQTSSSSSQQFQLNNSNIDQLTRHRLISNLVRQYQQQAPLANGNQAPILTTNLPNQQQIELFLRDSQHQHKQQQQSQHQQQKVSKSLESNEIDIQSMSPNSELRGLRRSSVSPISGASSECSSSSNANYFHALNNSSSSNNSSSENEPSESHQFESFNENMNEEPSSPLDDDGDDDEINCDGDCEDEAEKDNCWRPW